MVFDFEGSQLKGFYIVPVKDRLTTESLYGPEIDAQVEQLKGELDAVVKKMKAELGKPRTSLFGK